MGVSLDNWALEYETELFPDGGEWERIGEEDDIHPYLVDEMDEDNETSWINTLASQDNAKLLKICHYYDSYMYLFIYPDGKIFPVAIEDHDGDFFLRTYFYELMKDLEWYVRALMKIEQEKEDAKQKEIKELEKKLRKLKDD